MKTHEKILLVIIGFLLISGAIGWILWTIERGNRIIDLESIREIKDINREFERTITDLEGTITDAQGKLEKYKSDYQREYEAANRDLEAIIGQNQAATITTETIEEGFSRLGKLLKYYFNHYGSGGFSAGPLDWDIFPE